MARRAALLALMLAVGAAPVQGDTVAELRQSVGREVAAAETRIIETRRYLHAHPELSNREVETARFVARRLRALGLEVREGVAHTGVIGVLRGFRSAPVVALRAELDALPVEERGDLPFRSRARTTYEERNVGVMHACGHDAHMAMLLGVAETLAGLRSRIPGTVVFLFQPAEEGAPEGERGGAKLMIEEGALKSPRPDAIFALHVLPQFAGGTVAYRSGGLLAGSHDFKIFVAGKQTHGAVPWAGVDPILAASQIVIALQTVASRQLDLTAGPVVISVGRIEGGIRSNIIPADVKLTGTLRALDPTVLEDARQRLVRTAQGVAVSAGATAAVVFDDTKAVPVTYNDAVLTARAVPVLQRVVGAARVVQSPPQMSSEDFAEFQKEVPGVMLFLGIRPDGIAPGAAAPNHSPDFTIDESALVVGTRVLAEIALDYLGAR